MKLVINRKKLEEARIERLWGMGQLAREAGISSQALRMTLRPNSAPRIKTIGKLCKALDLEIREIVTVEEGYDETRKRPGRKRRTEQNN